MSNKAVRVLCGVLLLAAGIALAATAHAAFGDAHRSGAGVGQLFFGIIVMAGGGALLTGKTGR